jgi:hypothetical protein
VRAANHTVWLVSKQPLRIRPIRTKTKTATALPAPQPTMRMGRISRMLVVHARSSSPARPVTGAQRGWEVAKRRISDDADGLRRLLDLLTEAGATAEAPIPVAVETRPHRRVPGRRQSTTRNLLERLRDRAATRWEAQQQPPGVAVGPDRRLAHGALGHQRRGDVLLQDRRERAHQDSPLPTSDWSRRAARAATSGAARR